MPLNTLHNEAIAIIGMGCRFPGGADDPDKFWQLLSQGVDAIRPVPPDRWNVDEHYDADRSAPKKMYVREAGFLSEPVDQFDANFFGISPREAEWMDPQQRLVLEVAWEALEHAGIAAVDLRASRTSVFIGAVTNDYGLLLSQNDKTDDDLAFRVTGNFHSVLASRMSYILGLMGPSWAINAACASSLVALHNACTSLLIGESDCAIAGGVHLILAPQLSINYCKAQMLAEDGRCKAFDAKADGFGRGEGCGLVVLKRLSDAQRDGDRVLALIKASSIMQDGERAGLTVPSADAQELVIRDALDKASLSPADIDVIEAHGTGTPVGDPVEADALCRVFGNQRNGAPPLVVASVKTNIGHLEPASGVAGLIKMVLSLQHEEIPPHLHLKRLPANVAFNEIPATVPSVAVPWPAKHERVRRAGISSFGFGTVAHLILEEPPTSAQHAPELESLERPNLFERSLHVVALSAKTEPALEALLCRHQLYLTNNPNLELANLAFTANVGREHFTHRLALVARDAHDLYAGLEKQKHRLSKSLPETFYAKPVVAFLFSGQGFSFYRGMGQELYETHPLFRESIERVGRHFATHGEPLSLVEVLDGDTSAWEDVVYSHVAVFAVEYALARLWQSFGIVPRLVIGHSLGEYAAAVIAGALTVEAAIDLIVARGRLCRKHDAGSMLAIQAAPEAVSAIIESIQQAEVACVNAPNQCVVSGSIEACQLVVARCQKDGLRVTRLPIFHAFHSSGIEPILNKFRQAAERLNYASPQISMVSSITGAPVGENEVNATYWVNNTRLPVNFKQAIECAFKQGANVFIEIGPHTQLLALAKSCATQYQTESAPLWLPSLCRDQAPWAVLLNSVAELYVRGADIDWSSFDKPYRREKIALPTYPFQRERYWLPALKQQQSSFVSVVEPHLECTTNEAAYAGQAFDFDEQALLKSARVILDDKDTVELVNQNLSLQLQLQPVCRDYILHALDELGWNPSPGDVTELSNLYDSLKVVPRHRRYFDRALKALAESGIIRLMGETLQVGALPVIDGDLDRRIDRLMRTYPLFAIELTLLRRVASKLADLWRGSEDALSLLYAPLDGVSAADVYNRTALYKLGNEMALRAVRTITSQNAPRKPLRILEVGAGTGSTTRLLLSHLPANATQYVFTDVSPAFLNQASQRFREYDFISYELFNVELSPESQGLPSEQFDIVIAANVLHAAKNISEAVQNVRRLLAPGGFLVATELVYGSLWLDLTFGGLEGWSRFDDFELRPDDLFLSSTAWQTLLDKQGFRSSVIQIGDGGQQAVIVAQAGIAQTREGLSIPTQELAGSQTWQNKPNSPASQFRLSGSRTGLIEKLELVSVPPVAVSPDQVEIDVEAAGLNIRDVLIATAQHSPGNSSLGIEFAGIVTAVGKSISESDFRIGDEVIGLGFHSMSSKILTSKDLVIKKPRALSFLQGAALPAAFCTAYTSLCMLARLKRDETVLIHADMDAIGTMAVQIATRLGARVFAVTRDAQQQTLLRRVGIRHVFDASNREYVDAIMSLTEQEGLDVVLNSLPDNFIPASLNLVKDGGRFVEIGHQGLWTEEEARLSYPNVSYFTFSLDQMIQHRPTEGARCLDILCQWYLSGQLTPPSVAPFVIERAPEAFRCAQNAQHAGKVVVIIGSKGHRCLDAALGMPNWQQRQHDPKALPNTSPESVAAKPVALALELSEAGTQSDRLKLLQQYVERQVREVLRWPEDKPLQLKQEFFDLGMDSLMAAEMSTRVQRDLGRSALPTPRLYDNPTVEQLSLYLEEHLQLSTANRDGQHWDGTNCDTKPAGIS